MHFYQNRLVIGCIQLLYLFSYLLGIFPFRYVDRQNIFRSCLLSKAFSFFSLILSLIYPLSCAILSSVVSEYIDFEFQVQCFTYILYVTGVPATAFYINLKYKQKIMTNSVLLMQLFRLIRKKYRRNRFQFDLTVVVLVSAKLRQMAEQLCAINLDTFGLAGVLTVFFSFSILITSFLYLLLMVFYLMVGAMFDNIWLALEKNSDRICADHQIEGKEIYLNEVYETYLKLRKCFGKLESFLLPLWIIALTYFLLVVIINYRQMYIGIRGDNEEQIVIAEMYGFLMLLLAAALVSFKANRLERYLGTFCIPSDNPQLKHVEWIDFSRIIDKEFRAKPFGLERLDLFGFIIKCVIFVKLIELMTLNNEMFLKDE